MSEYYIPKLFSFLRQLSENNNRNWFFSHKDAYEEYRSLWMEDVDRIIACMTLWEPAMASQTAKSSVYRFYRDIRFSQDKSPYKLFFSAGFSPYGRSAHRAGYYLQLDIRPEEMGLYGGLWCPDPAALKKIRNAIVDNIEEFEEIVREPDLCSAYPGWISTMLKTVPKGWAKNHPQAEYLRMKDYGKFCRCDEKFFQDPSWPEKTADLFSLLRPLIDFLNYSIDEDL